MSQSQFPPIPEVLLLELERRFAPSYPDLNASERDVWAKAGEGRVIHFLRHQFEIQERGHTRKTR